MTKITKLPPSITKLKHLQEINVSETPLKVPKLNLAMRGIEAIKEFFKQKDEQQAAAAATGAADTRGPARHTADWFPFQLETDFCFNMGNG